MRRAVARVPISSFRSISGINGPEFVVPFPEPREHALLAEVLLRDQADELRRAFVHTTIDLLMQKSLQLLPNTSTSHSPPHGQGPLPIRRLRQRLQLLPLMRTGVPTMLNDFREPNNGR